MSTQLASLRAQWSMRRLLIVALLACLALLASFAMASTAHAQAQFGFSTIALNAPGAPASGWVSVQWLNRAGTWQDVEGWQGPLEMDEETGAIFKQFAVYPRDYGRGPFRWVVYEMEGGPVFATSNSFYLPDGDGAALIMQLPTGGAGGPTGAAMAQPFSFATIAVHASDAPEGAWVGVQWLDATGSWNDVEGWQGPLDVSAATGEPYKEWGVYQSEYGRGPFRWVIYEEQGGPVLATSPRFFLPNGNGARLEMSLLRKIAVAPADVLTAEMAAAPETLASETTTTGLICAGGSCDFSMISLYAPNAPVGSLVGVQWQDGFGVWHDVAGWQGSLALSPSRNVPYTQWTFTSDELMGAGPFRWVIYNRLGDTILGVTEPFMLPNQPGVDLALSVAS